MLIVTLFMQQPAAALIAAALAGGALIPAVQLQPRPNFHGRRGLFYGFLGWSGVIGLVKALLSPLLLLT